MSVPGQRRPPAGDRTGPLYPQQRTTLMTGAMSVSCQQRTFRHGSKRRRGHNTDEIGGPLRTPDEKESRRTAGERSQQIWEEAMVRLSVLASLLLSLVIPSSATSAPLAKEVEINGVRLPYVEQGSGEPVVFVHGVSSDLRSWEPVREGIAKKYHFIAYTQRYFGTGPWPDDGKNLSVATLADDLAKFIATLNAGPVHLVGWSYGGQVAATAAVKNPTLVRASFCTRRVSLRCCRQTARKGKRRARTAPSCLPRLSQRPRQVTLFRLPSYYRRLYSNPARRVRPLASGLADSRAGQCEDPAAGVCSSATAGYHL